MDGCLYTGTKDNPNIVVIWPKNIIVVWPSQL